MMVTREFWRDRTTGQYWAVELTEGDVSACAGPLGVHDLNVDFLSDYAYSRADADRLQQEREGFDLVSAHELLLLDGE